MTDTNTTTNYDDMTKEQIIEIIEEQSNQVLKHKGEFFLILSYDQDYSSSRRCCDKFDIGDEVYFSGGRNGPRRFMGTVVDMITLSKEQLLAAIDESW